MVKKQQMRWTPRGAHLLLQVRTRVLNDQLTATFTAGTPASAGHWTPWRSPRSLPQIVPLSVSRRVRPDPGTTRKPFRKSFRKMRSIMTVRN